MDIADVDLSQLKAKNIGDEVSIFALGLMQRGADVREVVVALVAVSGDLLGTTCESQDVDYVIKGLSNLLRIRTATAQIVAENKGELPN